MPEPHMSEPTCITKAREHCAKFDGLNDTSTVFHYDSNRKLWRVSQLLAAYDELTQRAEAAEAERDDARLDLAEAAQHIGKGDAFRATLRAELEAVRAQRDAMDKLWADAVRELQKVDDERIQIRAERDALLVINGDLARDNETLEAERDALRTVDDAMVERALVAWFDEPGCPEEINSWGKVQKDSVDGGAALRVFMREALDAALAVQP